MADIDTKGITVEVVSTSEPWYKKFWKLIVGAGTIVAAIFITITASSGKTETKEQREKDKQLKARSESIAKKVAELEKHSAEMDKAVEAKKADIKAKVEKTATEAKKFDKQKEDIIAESDDTQSYMVWVMQRFGGEVKRN